MHLYIFHPVYVTEKSSLSWKTFFFFFLFCFVCLFAIRMSSNRFKDIFLVCATIFIIGAAYPRRVTSRDDSGTCGNNLTWFFNSETSTLTIHGTGEMTNYCNASDSPWSAYSSAISEIVLEDGLTSIGSHAFSRKSQFRQVSHQRALMLLTAAAISQACQSHQMSEVSVVMLL